MTAGSAAIFKDREDVGQRLARALGETPVVVGLPRGGALVAFEAAKALNAPLDLALARGIGSPGQPELALGAIIGGENLHVIVHRDIAAVVGAGGRSRARKPRKSCRRSRNVGAAASAHGHRRHRRAGRSLSSTIPVPLCGLHSRASLQQSGMGQLVVAVPVAPPDTIADLWSEVDKLICLDRPSYFSAVGEFYEDLRQTIDDEVVALVDRAARRQEAASGL